jgi:pyruvate,orthophosphate dikinase
MDPHAIDALLHPQLTNTQGLSVLARGMPTSFGAAIGQLTIDPTQVHGDSILVRQETSAEDMPAMLIARGVITLRGGMTSHAAVVMRGMGKPCISGLEHAQITPEGLYAHGQLIPTGTTLTMDGGTGLVFQGRGTLKTPALSPETEHVLAWADEVRTVDVWANADTPQDIERAVLWGANGIGLCRSEHMMFDPTHLRLIQQFILAPQADWRQKALDQLHHLHQKDLEHLLKAAKGKRLVVRLLDPPLHEFLPTSSQEKASLSLNWGISLPDLERLIAQRQEINPMMGQRGCRLGLIFPELYAMQIQALFQAADAIAAQGGLPLCGVMVPFIADKAELERMRHLFYAHVPGSRNITFGTMIETPRAALLAETLAPLVDFISFGTNDLTQMTWGLSRDDAAPITQVYKTLGISDPFARLDIDGVGQLLSFACIGAKKANPSIKISICGEHAADPHCLAFLQSIGIDSISCAPWALPRMRLAAGKNAASG